MTSVTPSPTRRHVLQGTAALAVLGATATPNPAASASFGAAPEWMTLLGRSEKGGRDYTPTIEGDLPGSLRGALYRNGPGLFERGSGRIRHLLDGDGLIQRLSFTDKGLRYQNRFVRTNKFIEEEAANQRLYATWTTRKSENFLSNIGGGVTESQAGVTVYPVHGKILARDEVGPTYDIDPETLETIGQIPAGENLSNVAFKAHSKMDPETGEWIMAGSQYGRAMTIHAAIYEPTLKLKKNFSFASPRQVYIHDFFATKSHLIFVLHPCDFSPLPFLSGFRSFTDSFTWNSDAGNTIAVISRDGGEPQFFEAPGAFMWHALNAFEDQDTLIADLVAYDTPDHFIGEDALLKNLMFGKMGHAQSPGTIRRYTMNLAQKTLTEEILDHGNHEFPMIDGRTHMVRQRIGYFTVNGLGALNTGLKRFDYETGATQLFDFGAETQVGEPVFIPAPGNELDRGFVIAQCLNGQSKKTFFALFDAQTIDRGPIAKIWLTHHVPISFHGAWAA